MKKKNRLLLVFALLFGCALFLNACGLESRSAFNDLSAAIEKTEASGSLQIVQEIKASQSFYSSTVRMTSTQINDIAGLQAGLVVQGGGQTAEMYYYADTVCFVENGVIISVESGSYEDLEQETASSIDLGVINAIKKSKVTKSVSDSGNIVYTVSLSKKAIKKMLGGLEEIADFPEKLDINFIVNKKGYLESYNYSFSNLIDGGPYTLNISLDAKVIIDRDKIDFSIPHQVKESIFDFIALPESYTDTADGAVKYYNLGDYKDVKYDTDYDKVIVLRQQSVDIYDAKTMIRQHTFDYMENIGAIDTDKGVLAVGFAEERKMSIYDLSDNSFINTLTTNTEITELVMDGECIIYCSNDWVNYITIYNYKTAESNLFRHASSDQPKLKINRKDQILYIYESNDWVGRLLYYDSHSGAKIYESPIVNTKRQDGRIYFDGQYVHAFGRVHDRLTGKELFKDGLVREYNGAEDFAPDATSFSSSKIDILSGISNGKPGMAVYDNSKAEDGYIYQFPFYADRTSYIGEHRFFISGKGRQYVALVDLRGIDGNYEGYPYDQWPQNTITRSEDGKLSSLKQEQQYQHSAADDKYVYLLNESRYRLEVYDIVTLEPVKSIWYCQMPKCIDADGGWLAVGFGGTKFFLYDTRDWSCKVITVKGNVSFIAIYDDNIIYASKSALYNFYKYKIETEVHSKLAGTPEYYSFTDINRDEGILYFCDSATPQLILYDLEAGQMLSTFSDSLMSDAEGIFFDGTYVHIYGSTLDKYGGPGWVRFDWVFDGLTGEKISESGAARQYRYVSGYSDIRTIYDDGSISVFSAVYNGQKCTIFYDVADGNILYIAYVAGTGFSRKGEAYIIFSDYSDTFYRVVL